MYIGLPEERGRIISRLSGKAPEGSNKMNVPTFFSRQEKQLYGFL
ncbi:MAG: hypothetical protein ACLFM1_01120 [Bacteroidales bacterium]